MMRTEVIPSLSLLVLLSYLPAWAAEPMDGGWTFQGAIDTGNNGHQNQPADMKFSLFDALVGGTQLGDTLVFDGQDGNEGPVPLDNGVFTVRLDFGVEVFNGDTRYLQIEVRAPHNDQDNGEYSPVSSRQEITAVPYALQTRGIYVDQSNEVGIGTTSPLTRLHVETDYGFSAIYAHNSWLPGSATGVEGVSDGSGPGSAGIVGVAVHPDPMGETYGVWGRSISPNGAGIYGQAEATSGTTYGVRGEVASPDGFAGYFTGPVGSKNYFQRKVGIGTTSPSYPLHVEGAGLTSAIYVNHEGIFEGQQYGVRSRIHSDYVASSAVLGESLSTSGWTYGVKGVNHSDYLLSAGVYGLAEGTDGIGVLGKAEATSGAGVGVFGSTLSPDGYAGFFGGVAGCKNFFAGRVGIGTQDPDGKLHVVSNANVSLNSGGILILEHDSSENQLAFDGNEVQARNDGSPITFHVNAAGGDVALVPNGGGKVGIGKSNPEVRLDVVGSIQYTGTITDVSDIRLKENIQPVTGALEMVRRLDGVYFNMKDVPEQREVGFIAQNVQEVVPDAVRIVDPTTGHLGVSYPSLIPVLAQAIKELQDESQRVLAERDRRLASRDDQIARLQAENITLAARLERIEKILETFANDNGGQ